MINYSKNMVNYRMIQQKVMHTFFPAWEQNIPSLGTKYSHTGNKTGLRLVVSLLLMLIVGNGKMWGQIDEGLYYIASGGNNGTALVYDSAKPKTNFYLCPTENWRYFNSESPYYQESPNNGMPFMTTYQCLNDNNYDSKNALWCIKKKKKEDTDYYYIIHLVDGKYLTRNTKIGHGCNAGRMRIHLESSPADDDDALFTITYVSKFSCYDIKTKKNDGESGDDAIRQYLNVSGGNKDSKQGASGKSDGPKINGTGSQIDVGGIIGLWTYGAYYPSNESKNDQNSRWCPESTLLTAPTISDVDALTSKVTVTDNNSLPSGYNVRYEFSNDGTPPEDPTASSDIMPSDGLSITETGILKMVIERYGVVLTEVAQKSVAPASCATPVISFDYTTSKISIICATAGATINYTTDGGTPTASSTPYNEAFSVTSATTIKAIATHGTLANSEVATLEITQVAAPTIQNNGSNAISITSATADAIIYYTINGETPTNSSTEYTGPLTENVSGVTIKAIAIKEDMITSEVGSGSVTLQCAAPVIVRSGNNGFTLTCPFPASGVTIYYTTNGSTPTTSSDNTTSGSTIPCSLPITVNAIAVATNYDNSTVTSLYLTQGMGGDGSAGDPYTIEYQSDVTDFNTKANTAAEASKHYKIIATGTLNFSGVNITQDFSGTFDGGLCIITGLSHALFNTINGGTVKNVVLQGVSISSGNSDGDAGAICNKASGDTRIYNCGILPTTTVCDENGNITGFTGSSVGGSRYVGGLVGLLDGTSRVINCFSYANITGGDVKAGIVGYNNYASKYNDLKTMVMNCMFYGNIVTGGSVYPIYGGYEISNDYKANTGNRLNNYNYFLYEAPFSINNHTTSPTITAYNCALAAEERYLVRFEFYRHLLNSNRELAAWYATGNAANGKGIGSDNKMLKWVVDKSIAPYPILKVQDKYPSVVNYDEEYTYNSSGDKVTRASVTEPNKGGIVSTLGSSGSLTINIQMGSGAIFGPPTDASIETGSVVKPIIDKDFDQYNFNYGKVQLPYYNDVGTKNYTGNRVVTGWKIVSMTGGTSGGYTETNYDAPNYNYADRDHYGKDIYTSGSGNSGRIFAQGAYFNVPTGVTAITIEPYWAKCAYLSNKYYDRYGYNTTDNLSQIGGSHYEASTPTITIDGSTQTVYTTFANARDAMKVSDNNYESGATVYDYAVVLVGNYHHHTDDGAGNGNELSNKPNMPLTVTSIDLNQDNEPDYCLIFRSGKQKEVCPIRYDFITLPGMAMALKMATHDNLAIPGNCKPYGWFEVTTTGLIKFGQFEHSWESKNLAPLILMGGVIDQFVSNNSSTGINYTNKTKYLLFGDNVWFQLLSDGTHSDKTSPTPHRPISITGGQFDILYLSGYFRPDATACTENDGDRNAKCYIDGGKFSEVAGAGQEKIDGNVTWIIDHADIDNFYGGGINSEKAITGNIHTIIKNSRVDVFCGGPKFGNMASTKTVETEATDCTFRKYFGGGFGGTSIYRDRIANQWESLNYINDSKGDWANWISNSYDKASGGSKRGNFASGKGVAVNYEYEFFGGAKGNVARLYIDYASFSLAQTNNVSSTLNKCTVLENFYGGGSLGAVVGDATSTLTDCTVLGNVFGAGYSVDIPTVKVRNTGGWSVVPYYNNSTAIYEEATWQPEVTYTWDNQSVSNGSNALVDDGFKIKTNESLEGLGAVTGNVTLTLNGSTNVTGNVFGGGEASAVKGASNTVTVNLQGNTEVSGNVYGGGDRGEVSGSTEVNITGGTITQNVFGGGKGVADDFTCDKAMIGVNDAGKCEDPGSNANKDKGTKVTISNGTVNGNVYGGGEVGRVEWNTQVEIGVGTGEGTFAPVINGSVFGAGKGKETHGYAALVRGNSTVTIQGKAKVRDNVYGGGEQATVGRYWVKGIPTSACDGETPPNENDYDVPDEMPYKTRRGGKCTVIVQGSAQIGPDDAANISDDAGHVFGAGKGVTPNYVHTGDKANWSKRMVDYNSGIYRSSNNR